MLKYICSRCIVHGRPASSFDFTLPVILTAVNAQKVKDEAMAFTNFSSWLDTRIA